MPWRLEWLALLHARQGDLLRAALWGAAERLREEIGELIPGDEREENERSLDAARQAVGPDTFMGEWAVGRALTRDQAVEMARRE